MALRVGYISRETGINLRRNLLMTVGAMLTVAVSLTLVGFGLLMRQGVNKATLQWRGGVELSIFLQPGVASSESNAVKQELTTLKGSYVKRFSYVDQQAAYQEFKRMFASTPDMVDSVKPDDLPPSYRVVPQRAELVDVIGARFKSRAGVRKVVYAKQTIDALLRVTRRAQAFSLGMAIVVLLAAALLIFNTIQLAIFARRREVAVMKLVGATNWFIRVPFMLEGMIEGLVGAVFAGVLLYFARNWVLGLLDTFLLGGVNTLHVTPGEALGTAILLVIVGAAVGAIGSAVAVRRFLDV
ncbi:MAG: ABC transporter permease [Actinobacteria bacterium]|nr:ABC transporter permease [Actinomycetota bacterium]MBV8961146.1 ABC transporter permease [Actinomycetota bacterium]MBV9665582.1 ABC transporter permease [Actinomycetota bacterium]